MGIIYRLGMYMLFNKIKYHHYIFCLVKINNCLEKFLLNYVEVHEIIIINCAEKQLFAAYIKYHGI